MTAYVTKNSLDKNAMQNTIESSRVICKNARAQIYSAQIYPVYIVLDEVKLFLSTSSS